MDKKKLTLTELRLKKGLTQAEVAEKAGLGDRSNVCRMERGAAQPLATKFLAVCEVLGVDPREVDLSAWEIKL